MTDGWATEPERGSYDRSREQRAGSASPILRAAPVIAAVVVAAAVWTAFPRGSIVEDSYFYLVTARRMALEGSQSFSGLFISNGFHPLWLYMLGAEAWLVAQIQPEWLWHAQFAVPLSLALLALGLRNLWVAAENLELAPAVVVTPMAAYLTMYAVLYSEAHLFFAALATLLRVASRPNARDTLSSAVLFGSVLAFTLLSRLDSVFVVAGAALWYALRHRSLRALLVPGLVCTALVSPYLVTNALYFGGLTPVSGYMKSTFPHPIFTGIEARGLGSLRFSGYRVVEGLLPTLFGWVVLLKLKPSLSGPRALLWVCGAGSVGHFVYTAFFAWGYTAWYWYYVLPVTFAALCSGLVVARFGAGLARFAKPALLLASLGLAGLVLGTRTSDQASRRSKETLAFVEGLGEAEPTVMVSEFPGRVAFYSHAYVIAADMLTGNRELYEAMKASGNALAYLFDLAREAGHPVEYVIDNGGKWLEPSDDDHTLYYYDPRLTVQRPDPIGVLSLGPRVASAKVLDVWDARCLPGCATAP